MKQTLNEYFNDVMEIHRRLNLAEANRPEVVTPDPSNIIGRYNTFERELAATLTPPPYHPTNISTITVYITAQELDLNSLLTLARDNNNKISNIQIDTNTNYQT